MIRRKVKEPSWKMSDFVWLILQVWESLVNCSSYFNWFIVTLKTAQVLNLTPKLPLSTNQTSSLREAAEQAQTPQKIVPDSQWLVSPPVLRLY